MNKSKVKNIYSVKLDSCYIRVFTTENITSSVAMYCIQKFCMRVKFENL